VLCPGPTRNGSVEALDSDVSATAIYRKLAEPGPVVDAGACGGSTAAARSSSQA
jgi:hypothetical protein